MKKKAAILSIITLCICLTALATQMEKDQTRSQSPYWWKIELKITVSGKYHLSADEAQTTELNGKYAFSTTVLGTMQEDDNDYIFMQAFQEIRCSGWLEAVKEGGDGQWRRKDLKHKIKPDVTLNYVFKKNGILSFDFDFQPMPLPLCQPGSIAGAPQLTFPESAGDLSMKNRKKYKGNVSTGSNQVELPEKSIYDKQLNNLTFQWSWNNRDRKHQAQEIRWRNRHQVKVELNIVRLRSKDK